MSLKKKGKVPSERNLETSSDSSNESETELSQIANVSAKSSFPASAARSNLPRQPAPPISSNESHLSVNSDIEKSPSPSPTFSRPVKKVRKRDTSPARKRILRPNANFPDDLHVLTTNISRLVEQQLASTPKQHPKKTS